MSQYLDSGYKTFNCDAAVEMFQMVSLGANGVQPATASTDAIGTATRRGDAGDPVAVKLFSAPGTHKCLASQAIPVGSEIATAADGKVTDSPGVGSYMVGVALEAASADGDVIECMLFLRVEN